MADHRANRRHAFRSTESVTIILCNLLLAMLFGTFYVHAADVDYVYDELGRLRAVIDLSSDTAIYNYDAVGNLLSITRQNSAVVSIIEFSPKVGPTGTAVSIYGTGFSTTPSENTVTFNGMVATVTAASATQIVASVPSGATTGPIAVTTPSGSATSADVFTVSANNGAPTITGFTPTVGVAGTSVSVTGMNFDNNPTRDETRFNIARATVSSATTTSLSATVPTGTGSGRISVTTAIGKGVSDADFFIPPSPYIAADVAYTGRMAIGGPGLTVTISTPNKIGLVVFDGAAGQRISLQVTNSTFPFPGGFAPAATLTIYKPDGGQFVQTSWTTSGSFLDVQTLPVTGTYTMMLDPWGTNTGQATLTLYNIPADDQGTITPGGPPVNISTTVPGQRASLTFSG